MTPCSGPSAFDFRPRPRKNMSSSLSPRSAAMRAIATRVVTPPDIPASNDTPVPTSQYFGMNTLGARQMRDKLPKEIYAKLVAAIGRSQELGPVGDADLVIHVSEVILDDLLGRPQLRGNLLVLVALHDQRHDAQLFRRQAIAHP